MDTDTTSYRNKRGLSLLSLGEQLQMGTTIVKLKFPEMEAVFEAYPSLSSSKSSWNAWDGLRSLMKSQYQLIISTWLVGQVLAGSSPYCRSSPVPCANSLDLLPYSLEGFVYPSQMLYAFIQISPGRREIYLYVVLATNLLLVRRVK